MEMLSRINGHGNIHLWHCKSFVFPLNVIEKQSDRLLIGKSQVRFSVCWFSNFLNIDQM